MTRVSDLLRTTGDLPAHEGRRLIAVAIGRSSGGLIADPEVPSAAAQRFHELVERRRSGEPLQYLEGDVQFGPLTLRIDGRALIPRPETERMWEVALELIGDNSAPIVVDLCTGSGNLAIAFKTALPGARVVATDISAAALQLARENADDLGAAVEFIEGDLFDPLPADIRGRVDLVISNPPYIAEHEVADLPGEVKDHEPMSALVAGPLGTEVLERIAYDASEWLRPGGVVVCEMGETQSDACRRMFARYEPTIHEDMAGRPRYVIGTQPKRGRLH